MNCLQDIKLRLYRTVDVDQPESVLFAVLHPKQPIDAVSLAAPGSTPQNVGNSLGGTSESAIWFYNTNTHQLTGTFTFTNKSSPLSMFADYHLPQLIGSILTAVSTRLLSFLIKAQVIHRTSCSDASYLVLSCT